MRDLWEIATDPPTQYYVAPRVGSVLTHHNETVTNPELRRTLEVINGGLRMFSKNRVKNITAGGETVDCMYRVCEEGMGVLMPHCSKQVLRVEVSDLQSLLQRRKDGFLTLSRDSFSAHAQAAIASNELREGPVILVVSVVTASNAPVDVPFTAWLTSTAMLLYNSNEWLNSIWTWMFRERIINESEEVAAARHTRKRESQAKREAAYQASLASGEAVDLRKVHKAN